MTYDPHAVLDALIKSTLRRNKFCVIFNTFTDTMPSCVRRAGPMHVHLNIREDSSREEFHRWLSQSVKAGHVDRAYLDAFREITDALLVRRHMEKIV